MKKQKTIAILTRFVPQTKPWDQDSVKTGLAGSEEAVVYMAKELAKLDYKVLVFGKPPANSPHSHPEANPRYFNPHKIHFKDKLDIIISWRQPKDGVQLKTIAHKVYLWPHDVVDTDLTDEEIDAFDDVLWLSEWQRSNWIARNPRMEKFTHVFGNGIEVKQFKPIKERINPYSCIYGSNYGRGLDILLDLWPRIKEHQPRASLDIYYGWQSKFENGRWINWQCMVPEKEAKMRKQIALLPDVREHGTAGHLELNRAFSAASFWTYPCSSDETFCITALKAQYAGAIPVILEGSALPETVRHGYRCTKQEEYLATLLKAFDDAEKITLEDREKMREFICKEYTWSKIAARWKTLFDSTDA